jgi:hypothetical protein
MHTCATEITKLARKTRDTHSKGFLVAYLKK